MPEERTDLGNAQGDQGQQGDSGDQGNQNQQGQQGDQGNQGQQATQTFEIPEEHREKGWAKKVKSREDVFKQLNSMEELIGKKSVPFDYENATENEIKEHIGKTRPESIDTYDWGEEGAISKDDKEFYGKMLQENGISPYIGNKLIKNFTDKQSEIKGKMFSKDGFEEVLKESFGDKFQQTAGETANAIKGNLNEKDAKALDGVPNQYLGLIYRLTNNIVKNYGVNEGGDKGTPSGQGSQNVEEMRKTIKTQIKELSNKPHRYADKKALQDKLDETYKRDPRLKEKR